MNSTLYIFEFTYYYMNIIKYICSSEFKMMSNTYIYSYTNIHIFIHEYIHTYIYLCIYSKSTYYTYYILKIGLTSLWHHLCHPEPLSPRSYSPKTYFFVLLFQVLLYFVFQIAIDQLTFVILYKTYGLRFQFQQRWERNEQ